MTTMTDSRAAEVLERIQLGVEMDRHNLEDGQDRLDALATAIARLREPAGVDYNYRAIAHLIGSIFFAGDFKAETANERTLESLLKEVGTRYTSLAEVEAGYEALSTPQPPAEAQAQVPSYDALLIIAQSVCGALERAGITDCDDPGEAIDVLRERYEAQAQAGSGSPMLATPEQVGLLQGPDDCPHLQINGVSVAVFPAGTWAEVCDALDSITGSTAPPSAPVGDGDGPIDASGNAAYIEHCADRLERCGLRVTAGALRVIAHEHRALAQQSAACTACNDRSEVGGATPEGFETHPCPECAQQPAPVAPTGAVQALPAKWRATAKIAALNARPIAPHHMVNRLHNCADELDAAIAYQQPAACDMGELCIGCEPRNADGSCTDQQPAAVDEAMVTALRDLHDRVLPAAIRYHNTAPGYVEEAQEIVARALAAQPGGSDNGR